MITGVENLKAEPVNEEIFTILIFNDLIWNLA